MEHLLLVAIRDMKFGEMYDVDIPECDDKPVQEELTPCQRDLIEAIRNGLQEISILSIHNGEPAFAETDCVIRGFRCRKKIKFPTSH